MKKATKWGLFLAALIIFAYCKEPTPVPPTVSQTNTEKLAGYQKDSKMWQRIKVIEDGADITANLDPCQLDNEYLFYKNQTYVFREGEKICTTTDPDTFDIGTWKFNATKDSILTTETGGGDWGYFIKQLTENSSYMMVVQKN